jgi:hypothetical protein
MRNYLLIGLLIANIFWFSVEFLRAWISQYFGYQFTVFYATLGVFEWVGDLIAFGAVVALSSFLLFVEIKWR